MQAQIENTPLAWLHSNTNRVFSPQEVAANCDVLPETVMGWIVARTLPSVRTNKHHYIERRILLKAMCPQCGKAPKAVVDGRRLDICENCLDGPAKVVDPAPKVEMCSVCGERPRLVLTDRRGITRRYKTCGHCKVAKAVSVNPKRMGTPESKEKRSEKRRTSAKKSSNEHQVNVRVPKSLKHFIVAEAKRREMPASHMVGDIVADYFRPLAQGSETPGLVPPNTVVLVEAEPPKPKKPKKLSVWARIFGGAA